MYDDRTSLIVASGGSRGRPTDGRGPGQESAGDPGGESARRVAAPVGPLAGAARTVGDQRVAVAGGAEVRAVIPAAGFERLQYTFLPRPGEVPAALFRRIAARLVADGCAPLDGQIFGRADAAADCLRVVAAEPVFRGWPFSWVAAAGCVGAGATSSGIGGVQLTAGRGGAVHTILLEGRPVARVVDTPAARHCFVGGVGPGDVAGISAEAQARMVFERLEWIVGQAGMTFREVARTWFFLEDILAWYGPFNGVRNSFFAERGVTRERLPASTGVGAANLAGAALVANAYALQPVGDGAAQVAFVLGSRQCPAADYGSSFSRAVEFRSATGGHLTVSGTASIAADGRSEYDGDRAAQVRLTLEVIGSIIEGRGYRLGDVVRGTCYVKRAEDGAAVAALCAGWPGLEAVPMVYVVCDVCRDELLCEIELDAVR